MIEIKKIIALSSEKEDAKDDGYKMYPGYYARIWDRIRPELPEQGWITPTVRRWDSFSEDVQENIIAACAEIQDCCYPVLKIDNKYTVIGQSCCKGMSSIATFFNTEICGNIVTDAYKGVIYNTGRGALTKYWKVYYFQYRKYAIF